MATEKQKKAFVNSLENNGNISKSMKEAGYSDNYAKNPQDLTKSKGWQELLEENFPDDLIQKKLKEGLNAVKISHTQNGPEEDVDYAVIHKYADTILKLNDRYPAKKTEISGKDGKDLVVTFDNLFQDDA